MYDEKDYVYTILCKDEYDEKYTISYHGVNYDILGNCC